MWESVRKFGLEYCDLPSQIWNVAAMLRVVALKIEGGAKSIPKIFYVLSAACAVCYIFSYPVFTACFVFVGCRQSGDLIAGILAMSLTFNSLIGITKLVCMYFNQDNVQLMVAGYIAYDRLPRAPSTNELLDTAMRSVKKRAVLFWITIMGNGFVYMQQPLLLPDRPEMYEEHVRFGLKYIFGTSNYQLAVVSIITSIAFICYVVSNITSLLIITTGYCEARMLALAQEMRELWSDALQHHIENFNPNLTEDNLDENATKELNNYVQRRLHLIVQSHAINIGLVKKVDAIFRNAIAVEFILIGAALIAHLLGGLVQTGITLPFPLMQVSMDCYIGQKLMDANQIFVHSVYDCKWENFDVHNMKTVLIILKMSQKKMSLTAGRIATLDFGCLMALYKSVYSAYAAIRSVLE